MNSLKRTILFNVRGISLPFMKKVGQITLILGVKLTSMKPLDVGLSETNDIKRGIFTNFFYMLFFGKFKVTPK